MEKILKAHQRIKKFCGTGFVAVVAVWLAFAVQPALAQIVPASPEAKSFKLGSLEISVLRDSGLTLTNFGSIFGLNASPAAVAKILSDAGASTNEIHLDVDVLLIRMPHHLVLIDSGFGAAGRGVVQKSLASVGVSANDITDIFISHSHLDHVGGLVSEGQLAFPKATIRMSAKEWAFMQSSTNAAVPVIKAQVKTFKPGHSVLPGITPVPLYGHTPGHTGYEISSEGKKLVAIGDMAHSSIVSLAEPEWTIAWDGDKAEGAATRRHELQQIVDTHELVFAPHFPFPGVGRIEPSGDGFKFVPDLPSDQ